MVDGLIEWALDVALEIATFGIEVVTKSLRRLFGRAPHRDLPSVPKSPKGMSKETRAMFSPTARGASATKKPLAGRQSLKDG